MSSGQDKTEEATSKKLSEARGKGNIARSKELSSAGLLLIGGLAMQWAVPSIGSFLAEVMRRPVRFDWQEARDPSMMLHWTAEALLSMAWVLLPFFSFLALLLIALNTLPSGIVFNLNKLLPSFEKLNPLEGIKRLFSMNSVVELGKSILKVGLIGGTFALVLRNEWPQLLMMNRMPADMALELGLRMISQTFIILGAVQMFIALIDVPYQKFSLGKSLRMSKQEVKDEHKNSEGNPQIKGKIRQLQMAAARARIDQRVPEADVVIVNPTHYSVAIKYDPKRANAPFVVAKGEDEMAARIRLVAKQHDKTVISLPELTRAIYYSTRVDQEVPAGLYTAVAYVLNYVLQLKAHQAGKGKMPKPLAPLYVPPELRQPER
ncbi:MAG: flagellar biosynthesis protein FlhB [Aeromonas sp.]